jgi:type I restriction enzyme R subunit
MLNQRFSPTKPNVLREEPTGRHWAGKMHGGKPGDRRAGVVWHTQGSGKSFTMLFFAARVTREPAMRNRVFMFV